MAPEKFLRDLPFSSSEYAASASSNFKMPPLDGSLKLPEIYDWHLENNPGQTLFMYESAPVGYTHLTYREIVPASHRAAERIASAMSINLNDISDDTPPVAVVATTDTVTHFCVLLGMLKAGISYITISPRNSAAAVVHLAEKVGAEHVFYSSEPAVGKLIQESSELMVHTYSRSLRGSRMPEFGDIFRDGPYPILTKRNYDLDFPAIYSHSSGSTSLPKPIPWTHAFLLQLAMAPVFGAVNFCNEVVAYHSASMSHGTGKHLLPYIASSGMIIAVFTPSTPARFPSPEATYQAFVKLNADYVLSFPNLLESWAADPEKVEGLKKVKRAIFTGSLLNKEIGDYLASQGVQLAPFYGLAEAGVVGSFIPAPQGMDWEYFPLTAHSGGVFVDRGDDLHELMIVEQPFKRLSLSNSTFGDARAYATRDSFVEHPSKSGYWKVCGRFDDRIVHPSGEKTNPVLMEQIIGTDPQVKSAIVFGNGRNQTGVLIQLEDLSVFDPDDRAMLMNFRQYIQPKVNDANRIAASYSRIFPEMILTTSPSKPFMYTEKGSLRRGAILKAYTPEIDELYKLAEQTVSSNVLFPTDWHFENILNFVQAVLQTIPLHVPKDEDVFRYGCNSIQVTRIEVIIRGSLKEAIGSRLPTKSLRNFVYEHQSPQAIAQFLHSFLQLGSREPPTSTTSRVKEMEKIMAPLITSFPSMRPVPDPVTETSETVILITGTTGALGSNFLATVLNDNSVSRVYALNRKVGCVPTQRRQQDTFTQQGLDLNLLSSPKLDLLDVDLTQSYFGLQSPKFEEMRHSVTHIYHLGKYIRIYWGLLVGLRNLIDFALSSSQLQPPAFFFASSIGVFRNISVNKMMPESSLPDLRDAEGQGYEESKAIAERILEAARTQTSLRPTIIRFGQLSGGVSGAWTTKEWFPTILKSSTTIRMLPELQGHASFLPVDCAARVLNDVRDVRVPFLHLAHPQPTPVSEISAFFSKALELPLVPYAEWIQAVEGFEGKCTSSPEHLSQIPALKILHFFREDSRFNAQAHTNVLGFASLDTAVAESVSPTLRNVPRMGTVDADKWLKFWRSVHFI
uniref:Putative acetyl-CoA synthetase-like protein n=1 Tax=Moniliophthora roreri TaxID=221103 RepID=A0A0W0G571_MONRR